MVRDPGPKAPGAKGAIGLGNTATRSEAKLARDIGRTSKFPFFLASFAIHFPYKSRAKMNDIRKLNLMYLKY